MHPLAYWAIAVTDPGHLGGDDRLGIHAPESTEELVHLEQDGRWAAAIRRWAEMDAVAEDSADRVVPAPELASRRSRGQQTRPSW